MADELTMPHLDDSRAGWEMRFAAYAVGDATTCVYCAPALRDDRASYMTDDPYAFDATRLCPPHGREVGRTSSRGARVHPG